MTNRRNEISPGKPRQRVQVSLPDGRIFAGPVDTPLNEFLRTAYTDRDNPPVAAIVDGTLRELAWPVATDAAVEPIFVSDSDGMRIYCRSLSFLLIVAAHDLYPEAHVFVDYSVPYGGYFCRVEERDMFSTEELAKLKEHMRRLVSDDLPIERLRATVPEAAEIFAERGEHDKVHLLEDVQDDHVHLYSLNGFSDYSYGYMVATTGVLHTFTLESFSDGFILRFPRREDPTRLLPAQKFTELRRVFNEYGEWLDAVGIRNVASLNEAIRSGRIEEVVLVSEALHEQRIAEIASTLARRHDAKHRLVFIAGPSSSGKTTFSKRLAVQLVANGIHPYPLGMDNYFIPRAKLEARGGEIDFDSLSALDIEYFQEQLHSLLSGKEVTLPRYDFKNGEREEGDRIKLKPDQLLIVEGIHGLNPKLLQGFADGEVFRIFVSALTQLNLDSHNRVSTTDTRLIRRIVRDAVYRGYPAEKTLEMWDNVRRGEKQNIFPYQEQADVMFNSALAYELSVLKPLVEPLLLQIRSPLQRIEAERLLAFLRWFDPYTSERIPGNSLLREFVGGSTLRDFTPSLLLTRGE
ncbi:MAG TPA: nucleoside kinase [Candidatus Acetothermia bacterium]|nr:nucleoside kinase [Candidatus Acetothermia bacterium]HEX32417.1 nucleoside kinase [Candidatus Acetothermia bacterium]